MTDKIVSTEIDLSSVVAFELPLFQALRRLQQAGEVHAKRLSRFGGLTPMQLMVLQVLATRRLSTLDLTGGAPELNPHFRRLVAGARAPVVVSEAMVKTMKRGAVMVDVAMLIKVEGKAAGGRVVAHLVFASCF